MPKKIDAAELERLIADDNVPDEEIAAYLKPAAVRTLPFEPALAVNEATVEASSTRGIVSLTVATLNARGNRKRLAAYTARIDGGWKGLKLLAEGDSWFQYPILLRDVIDNLSDDYAIYSIAQAGDTLENMVRATGHIEELIETHRMDGLLFSAGGNDIAGDPLKSYLRLPPVKGQSATDFISEAYEPFIAEMKSRFEGLAKRLIGRFPDLHIFCHGYDWPFPHTPGLWLSPVFEARQVPATVQVPILKLMIDRYYSMLKELAPQFGDRFHVVDCRGIVGKADQWFDELHPVNAGFKRVASQFRAEINKTYGIATRGLESQARITWRPQDEAEGPRVQTRTYSAGAIVTIGRNSDREIMLEDQRVSRNHARLTVGPVDVGIEDLDSSNGTLLDGKPVTRARWLPGQIVRIGHFQLDLEYVAAQRKAAATPVVAVTQPPRSDPGGTNAPKFMTPDIAIPPLASGFVAGAGAVPFGPPQPLQRLEITITENSISRQKASAWAIGVFQNTNPLAVRGAARAIDDTTDGLLSAVLERNNIDARVGKITSLPITEGRGAARNLFLTGLGAIAAAAPKVLEIGGENLARMLIDTRIFELATVPIGSNSGLSLKSCVEGFLTGLLRGIRQTDENQAFRALTICEIKKTHFTELTKVVQQLQSSGALAALGFDANITIRDQSGTDSRQLAQLEDRPPASQHVPTVLLDVSKTAADTFEYRFLRADNGPTVQLYSQKIEGDGATRISNVLKSSNPPNFDTSFGKTLADAYIPQDLQSAVNRAIEEEAAHLIVMHCAASSVVPWEAILLEGGHPALTHGITRRIKSEVPEKTKPRPRITRERALRMLLLQNPTGDLSGAEKEATAIKSLFTEHGADVKILVHKDASKEAVLAELRTGTYDVLHHCGHALFEENVPERSGILLSKDPFVVLSAVDLTDIATVPHLIFLNACQSGRVRDARPETAAPPVTKHTSLAEGFILGGVRNFVGTYWVVGDDPAQTFALTFYKHLLNGVPIGHAMRHGRKVLADVGPGEWANYLQFGDASSVLSKPAGSATPSA